MPVYFIQAGESGPVKIGFSKNIASRLAKMQVDSPHTLYLRTSFEGGLAEEAEFHARFSEFAIRGEWFRPAVLDHVPMPEPEQPPAGDRLLRLLREIERDLIERDEARLVHAQSLTTAAPAVIWNHFGKASQ